METCLRIRREEATDILSDIASQFNSEVQKRVWYIIEVLNLENKSHIKIWDLIFLIPQEILQVRIEFAKKAKELVESDDFDPSFNLNNILTARLHKAKTKWKLQK